MKRILSLMICMILLVLLIGNLSFVSAVEIPTVSSEGFNFISWFKHFFKIQIFSVVGENRDCDVYARKTIYYDVFDSINVRASDAGCNYALIDLFDHNWNPIGEWKDSLSTSCYDWNGCIVEIYCCPHPECYKDSQCESWVGTGSECKRASANDPYINYIPGSYYYYCTEECTGSDITCWREESGVCVSRTYDCGYSTYPNCPTSYPYTSKSKCEANLCASHSTYSCYNNDVYWYNSCGNREDKKQECGTSEYTGSNYCYDSDVYRDYITRGCSGSACTSPTSKIKQTECGTAGCLNGVCSTVVICASGADTNSDGTVSLSELWVVADKWVADTETRTKLGEAIMDWAQGCGNW